MKKGFTLIELLAVLAIIGIIAILVVPNILKTYSENKNRLSDIQKDQIKSATEMYINDYCIYPISDEVTCGFNTSVDGNGFIVVTGGSISLGTLSESGYLNSGEISNNCDSNSSISVNSSGKIDVSNVTCNFNR